MRNGAGPANSGVLRNISGANTWSGNVSISAASIGSDSGTLTISGRITGTTLQKAGPGTLSLTNATNSYSGGAAVSNGTLLMTVPAALPGFVDVRNGGTLRFANGLTGTVPLFLNGDGFAGGGALRSDFGINQWNAPINLQGNSTIYVESGELRLPGAINGNAILTKTGLGRLTLLATNAYTGGTVVDAGVLGFEHATDLPVGTLTW